MKNIGDNTAAALVMSACDDEYPAENSHRHPGNVNYDNCIIKHMRGVQNQLAAALVFNSCTKEYPTRNHANQNKHTVKPTQKGAGQTGKTSDSPSAAVPAHPESAPSHAAPVQQQLTPAMKAQQRRWEREWAGLKEKAYEQVTGSTQGGRVLCQYKTVMTNADYRRCGLNPP